MKRRNEHGAGSGRGNRDGGGAMRTGKGDRALRKYEERMRAALETLGIGEWELDCATRVLRHSKRTAEIFGYSEQVLDWTLESLIAHVVLEDRHVVNESLERALKTREPWEFECRIVRADGVKRRVWLRGSLETDAGGEPRRFRGLICDMGDRKGAEEALKESRERERAQSAEFERVLDAVPAAVWISHDARGDVITGNRLSYEWLKIPQGSNASKSAPEGVRPETFTIFKDGVEIPLGQMPVRVSSAGKEVRDYEFDFVYPDGSKRHVIGNATPLFDDDGKPRGSVSAFIDVTGRKQAEGDLRRTRDYLEALFNYANAPIIVWDPEFRITGFNKAFEFLTGRKAEEVIGQSLEILFPLERREQAFSLIRRTQQGEQWKTVEIPILRMDGSVRTLIWNSATLFGPDGRTITSTIAQGQDITERREAEEDVNRYLKSLEFLAECATGFLKRQSSPEVFDFIAEKIAELVGEGLVIVTEVDGLNRCRIVRAARGDHATHRAIADLLGRELVGLRLPIEPRSRLQLLEGTLVRVEGSVRELFHEEGTDHPSDPGAERLDRNNIYAIPCIWEDDLLGMVTILSPVAFPRRHERVIETFVNQAAIVLNRIRTDDALSQREEEYRTLMEDASDGIFIADSEGRLVAANSRACELSGYSKNELDALPISTLVFSDEIPLFSGSLKDVVEGKSAVFEHRLRRKDGSPLYVETSARMLADGRYQAILRDVTDRKGAEEEFARAVQSEVFDKLISALREFRHGEGLAMNLHRLALFGKNYQALLTAPGAGPGDAPGSVDAYAHSRLEIAVREYLTLGHMRLREIASLIRAIQGDINQQMLAGEEPISAADILKLSEMLKSDLADLLHAARRAALGDSIDGSEAGNRIFEHVHSILRKVDVVSRYLSSRYTSNVSDIVRTVVPIIQTSSAGIAVEIRENSPDLRAIISPADLGEILSILLTNSAEALAGKGAGEKRIIVRLGISGVRVRIEVEDNGEGVRPEIRGDLFNGNRTTKGPGHGSGLSFARNHLRKYNGTLMLDDEFHDGARFVIELVQAASTVGER